MTSQVAPRRSFARSYQKKMGETMVFHVTLGDQFRAHLSGDSTSAFDNPIAQSIRRNLKLASGAVEVDPWNGIKIRRDSSILVVYPNSNLLRVWLERWNEGMFRVRRPFHFKVNFDRRGVGQVTGIWR